MASIASLPKGDYLLNVAAEAYETVERDIVVAGESYSTEVGLIERLITPYNLTADVTTNAESPELIDVLLSWNQDLGFVDSFETYEDFSTKFGDWTTYDLDQMPVYPIGLGSADNIVSFPGSGTATQPQPSAPRRYQVALPSQTQYLCGCCLHAGCKRLHLSLDLQHL